MDELAHWIMDVGTGIMLGIIALGCVDLLARLLAALPDRVPLITPAWEAIRRPIQWVVDRLPR